MSEDNRRPFWDHQEEILDALVAFAMGCNFKGKGFVVAPGGTGKTWVFSRFISYMNVRTLVLSPTMIILNQNFDDLSGESPELNATKYYSNEKNLDGDIIFTTYRSFVELSKAGKLDPDSFELIICDEIHRGLSEMRSKALSRIKSLVIGFTATDKFNEQKNVKMLLLNEIYRMSLEEAIEAEICLPLRGVTVDTEVDVSNINILNSGNLDLQIAEKHLNTAARNKVAADYYRDNFLGFPTVVFCLTIKHAQDMCELFREAGVPCRPIHSKVPHSLQQKTIEAFENGKIDVICAVNSLMEGWDCSRVKCVFNLRPTYSWIIAEQRAFRAARKAAGKDCGIIVEFLDKYRRNNYPILVQHLFGIRRYRSGSYVAAPKRLIEKENRSLDQGLPIRISDSLRVNTRIETILDPYEIRRRGSNKWSIDFRDPLTIKEILLSKTDVDYRLLTSKEFFDLRFSYQGYSGTGETLLRRYFGTRGNEGRRTHNFEFFLNEIMGDHYFAELHELMLPNDIMKMAATDGPEPYAILCRKEFFEQLDDYLDKHMSEDFKDIFLQTHFEEAEQKPLAKKYRCSRGYISVIKRNVIWRLKNLPPKYEFMDLLQEFR